MDMPVTVFTNERHYWLLPPFLYLMERFWPGQRVTVVGYGPLPFELPAGVSFASIAPENYPAKRWSNGLIEFLERSEDPFFVMLLEDYWLTRPVDAEAVELLWRYMLEAGERDGLLRIDLSNDRARHPATHEVSLERDGRPALEVIRTPPTTPYQMSFQAAIWSRDRLIDALQRGENPWQAEIAGTRRLAKRPNQVVLGTRNHPVVYAPVYRARMNSLHLDALPAEELAVIRERGWLTR